MHGIYFWRLRRNEEHNKFRWRFRFITFHSSITMRTLSLVQILDVSLGTFAMATSADASEVAFANANSEDQISTMLLSISQFHRSDTRHGAYVVGAFRPAAFLAIWTVGVDGTLRDYHLSSDEIANAGLSIRPVHLLASVAFDLALFQTRQRRIAVNAHQLSIDTLDAAPHCVFGHSLGAEAVVSAPVKSSTALVHSRRDTARFFGAHGEFIVRISQFTVGLFLESILENLPLNVLP